MADEEGYQAVAFLGTRRSAPAVVAVLAVGEDDGLYVLFSSYQEGTDTWETKAVPVTLPVEDMSSESGMKPDGMITETEDEA